MKIRHKNAIRKLYLKIKMVDFILKVPDRLNFSPGSAELQGSPYQETWPLCSLPSPACAALSPHGGYEGSITLITMRMCETRVP